MKGISSPQPNLRRLNYIVAVADYGSITNAAARLHVSQPAISAAIKDCEQMFGFRLFVRNPAQGVALTPNGRAFVSRAKRLLEDAREFQAQAMGLSSVPAGRLEVGCFTPLAPVFMPTLIKGFSEGFPDISIQLHEGDLREVIDLLKSGIVEVAITYDIYRDAAVTFKTLLKVTPHACLSAKDPLAGQASISLAQLAERDMVALDFPATDDFVLNMFRHQGLEPSVRYRTKSTEMMRSLIGAGAGFSIFMFRPISDRSFDDSPLVHLPIRDQLPTTKVVLASPRQVIATRILDAFNSECEKLISQNSVLDQFLVKAV